MQSRCIACIFTLGITGSKIKHFHLQLHFHRSFGRVCAVSRVMAPRDLLTTCQPPPFRHDDRRVSDGPREWRLSESAAARPYRIDDYPDGRGDGMWIERARVASLSAGASQPVHFVHDDIVDVTSHVCGVSNRPGPGSAPSKLCS